MSGGKSRSTPEAGDVEGLNLWKAMSKKHGGSVGDSTSGARFTGFDPEGGSHQKFRAPSTVASDDSEETTTADHSYDYKAEVSTLRWPLYRQGLSTKAERSTLQICKGAWYG